jgi:hypothetical protein
MPYQITPPRNGIQLKTIVVALWREKIAFTTQWITVWIRAEQLLPLATTLFSLKIGYISTVLFLI